MIEREQDHPHSDLDQPVHRRRQARDDSHQTARPGSRRSRARRDEQELAQAKAPELFGARAHRPRVMNTIAGRRTNMNSRAAAMPTGRRRSGRGRPPAPPPAGRSPASPPRPSPGRRSARSPPCALRCGTAVPPRTRRETRCRQRRRAVNATIGVDQKIHLVGAVVDVVAALDSATAATAARIRHPEHTPSPLCTARNVRSRRCSAPGRRR